MKTNTVIIPTNEISNPTSRIWVEQLEKFLKEEKTPEHLKMLENYILEKKTKKYSLYLFFKDKLGLDQTSAEELRNLILEYYEYSPQKAKIFASKKSALLTEALFCFGINYEEGSLQSSHPGYRKEIAKNIVNFINGCLFSLTTFLKNNKVENPDNSLALITRFLSHCPEAKEILGSRLKTSRKQENTLELFNRQKDIQEIVRNTLEGLPAANAQVGFNAPINTKSDINTKSNDNEMLKEIIGYFDINYIKTHLEFCQQLKDKLDILFNQRIDKSVQKQEFIEYFLKEYDPTNKLFDRFHSYLFNRNKGQGKDILKEYFMGNKILDKKTNLIKRNIEELIPGEFNNLEPIDTLDLEKKDQLSKIISKYTGPNKKTPIQQKKKIKSSQSNNKIKPLDITIEFLNLIGIQFVKNKTDYYLEIAQTLLETLDIIFNNIKDRKIEKSALISYILKNSKFSESYIEHTNAVFSYFYNKIESRRILSDYVSAPSGNISEHNKNIYREGTYKKLKTDKINSNASDERNEQLFQDKQFSTPLPKNPYFSHAQNSLNDTDFLYKNPPKDNRNSSPLFFKSSPNLNNTSISTHLKFLQRQSETQQNKTDNSVPSLYGNMTNFDDTMQNRVSMPIHNHNPSQSVKATITYRDQTNNNLSQQQFFNTFLNFQQNSSNINRMHLHHSQSSFFGHPNTVESQFSLSKSPNIGVMNNSMSTKDDSNQLPSELHIPNLLSAPTFPTMMTSSLISSGYQSSPSIPELEINTPKVIEKTKPSLPVTPNQLRSTPVISDSFGTPNSAFCDFLFTKNIENSWLAYNLQGPQLNFNNEGNESNGSNEDNNAQKALC